jgi:hypothetical protein
MKIIRSRAKKNIGDILEDKWKVTGIKVIAEPTKGNPPFDPPRLGIYDYEVEPMVHVRVAQKARDIAANRTLKSLSKIADGIMSGKLNNVDPAAVLFAVDRIFNEEEKIVRAANRLENGPLVSFRTVRSR